MDQASVLAMSMVMTSRNLLTLGRAGGTHNNRLTASRSIVRGALRWQS